MISNTTWDLAQSYTRIKLCEFESLDAAYPACQLDVDALGFHIFKHHDIPWKVRLFESIFRHLPDNVERTLLTDVPFAILADEILTRLNLHAIQLYPDWSAAEVIRLRNAAKHPLRILKVMSALPEENSPQDDDAFMRTYAECVDAFLLDSRRIGGTGRVADWDHCAAVVSRAPRPVFLAGGLTADNVAEAIRRVKPFGVDVETGVSVRIPNGPLIKDLEKCAAFVAAVRRHEKSAG